MDVHGGNDIGADVSARRAKRLVITNTVVLNGGDAAILLALVELLRARFGPQTRIDVFDSRPEVARRLFPEIAFHPHLSLTGCGASARGAVGRLLHGARLRAASRGPLRRLGEATLSPALRQGLDCWRRADVVISTGGTYLVEQYALWDRFLDFEVARALGKKLVLFTQSVGAFQGDRRGRRLARVLCQADLVLLRDERSLANVRRLTGSRSQRWHVCPDVVFSLAHPTRLRAGATRTWRARGANVLVSVRRWDHFDRRGNVAGRDLYHASVAAMVEALVRRGAQVRFVSTCQGVSEYWMDDSREALAVRDRLPDDVKQRVEVDHEHHSPTVLMAMASEADLVVATRLHMAILALSAGTPVLPISYERKTDDVFTQLDQGQFVLDIDTMTPEVAVSVLGRFLEELPARRRELFGRIEGFRQDAIDGIELVADVLDEAPGSLHLAASDERKATSSELRTV